MVRLEMLDIGELWYFKGLSLEFLALRGERSLIITYGAGGQTRDRYVSGLIRVHDGLRQGQLDPIKGFYPQFAGIEEPEGELWVPVFWGGDWVGLMFNEPLPPFPDSHPKYWWHDREDLDRR